MSRRTRKPRQPRPLPKAARPSFQPEEEGGGHALPILLAITVIGVVVYVFMARDGNSAPEEYVEKCKPSHYVSHTKAAHGLVRITCMNKRGAESTVMVEVDE